MNEICNYIDTQIVGGLALTDFIVWGFCDQTIKTNQTHPLTVGDRRQVSFNDTKDGFWYHRCLSMDSSEPEDQQWGTIAYKQMKARMRLVLAHKVPDYEESFVFDFVNAMPQTLKISGYKQIESSENVNVLVNQREIYNQEFGGGKNDTNYEKHIIDYNLYAIEYDIDFIKCPVNTPALGTDDNVVLTTDDNVILTP